MFQSPDDVSKSWKDYSIELFQWFSNNQIKLDCNKWHPLVYGKNHWTVNVSGMEIKKTVKICLELRSIADWSLKIY